MPKRNSNANNAYQNAKEMRETLIASLKDCNSYEELQQILSKKEKNQRSFERKELSHNQTVFLDKLDENIEQLIKSRTRKFPEPAEDLLDQEDIDQSNEDDEVEDDQHSEADEEVIIDLTEESAEAVNPIEDLVASVPAPTVVKLESAPQAADAGQAPALQVTVVGQAPALQAAVAGQAPALQVTVAGQAPALQVTVVGQAPALQAAVAGQAPAPQVTVVGQAPAPQVAVATKRPPLSAIAQKRSNQLQQVRVHFETLQDKYYEFYNKGQHDKNYLDAAWSINSITNELNTISWEYVNKGNLDEFKNAAKNLFDERQPDIAILNSHRGWKQIVTNILTAILGLGVIYGIAAAINGSFTVFKTSTDAGNKVEDLAQSIDSLKEVTPTPV